MIIEVSNQPWKTWFVAWSAATGLSFTTLEWEAKVFRDEAAALAFMRSFELSRASFEISTGAKMEARG